MQVQYSEYPLTQGKSDQPSSRQFDPVDQNTYKLTSTNWQVSVGRDKPDIVGDNFIVLTLHALHADIHAAIQTLNNTTTFTAIHVRL